MRRFGICVVTRDRTEYLSKCIDSMRKSSVSTDIVIVDNSVNQKNETLKLAESKGVDYLDGEGGNCPHGQNIGFDYLYKKGCEIIFKSDDDHEFEPRYFNILLSVFQERYNTTAVVGGCSWCRHRKEPIRFIGNKWITTAGQDVTNRFILYHSLENRVVKVNHLHSVFAYKVSSALALRDKTRDVRGEVFFENLSNVAFREETEFSYLMKVMNNEDLLWITKACSYHHYAPGGIRSFDEIRLTREDEAKIKVVLTKLGLPAHFPPPFVEVVEE